MRVLIVGAGEPPPTFIARLITILGDLGVTVDVLEDSVPWGRLGRKLGRAGQTWHLSPAVLAGARAADVIHYQWPAHHLLWHGLATRLRKPSLLSLRGRQVNILPHLPGKASTRARVCWSLEAVTGVHAVSDHILGEARALGATPRRSFVVTPAVDTRFFSPTEHAPARQPFRVAMVGAVMWRKCYEDAILALREATSHGADIQLLIAGEGEERERINSAVRDLEAPGRVQLLGKRSPEGIRELLHTSHALLLTSLSEGIANVVIEAMSVGLPVVSTDAGGMREAVTDGVEGFVVPARDVHSMAARLVTLSRDEALCRAMGARGRATAVARFDLADQGRRFLEIYEELGAMRPVTLAMPDPLIWQAGLEYGLMALAKGLRGRAWTVLVSDRGAYLEPLVFAAVQLGIRDQLSFANDIRQRVDTADILVLPRLAPLDPAMILRALGRGKQHVLTSDPGIRFPHPRLTTFIPREWETLAGLCSQAAGQPAMAARPSQSSRE